MLAGLLRANFTSKRHFQVDYESAVSSGAGAVDSGKSVFGFPKGDGVSKATNLGDIYTSLAVMLKSVF